ncbi:hypothetical protein DL767_009279 [Monosporascus sp. MG133]|nr:hypothetical protein DL767_009279 [Monosporascus sp. MG133]
MEKHLQSRGATHPNGLGAPRALYRSYQTRNGLIPVSPRSPRDDRCRSNSCWLYSTTKQATTMALEALDILPVLADRSTLEDALYSLVLIVFWFQDVETEDSSDTSMFYFCHGKDTLCNGQSLSTRSLCLAVLYQFFRETACDTRDIAEDTKDDMKTLPVRLGKRSMLLVMAGVGALLDSLITDAILVTWLGIQRAAAARVCAARVTRAQPAAAVVAADAAAAVPAPAPAPVVLVPAPVVPPAFAPAPAVVPATPARPPCQRPAQGAVAAGATPSGIPTLRYTYLPAS